MMILAVCCAALALHFLTGLEERDHWRDLLVADEEIQ